MPSMGKLVVNLQNKWGQLHAQKVSLHAQQPTTRQTVATPDCGCTVARPFNLDHTVLEIDNVLARVHDE